MASDLKRIGPEDPTKINVNQCWELDYWRAQFGVSAHRLKEAVKSVGSMVSDVKGYLGI